MDVEKQDDQPECTFSSSVSIRDVALKTCRKQWTIGRGGERGSGISVLMARHDDDDDDDERVETVATTLIHSLVLKTMPLKFPSNQTVLSL